LWTEKSSKYLKGILKMNNYFKFISALFIIFCLSCSQNSSKKQLVGEGYKGVPWNTSYNDFKDQKNISYQSEYNFYIGTVKIDKDDPDKTNVEDMQYGGDFISALIKGFKLFNTYESPITNGVDNNYDEYLLPSYFTNYYVKDDDAIFCFNSGFLFSAITEVDDKNYDLVKSELDKKFKNGTIVNFPTYGEIQHVKSDDRAVVVKNSYSFKTIKYKKEKETTVYLIKASGEEYGEKFDGKCSLVFVDDNSIDGLKKDIENRIQELKKSHNQETEKSIKSKIE